MDIRVLRGGADLKLEYLNEYMNVQVSDIMSGSSYSVVIFSSQV